MTGRSVSAPVVLTIVVFVSLMATGVPAAADGPAAPSVTWTTLPPRRSASSEDPLEFDLSVDDARDTVRPEDQPRTTGAGPTVLDVWAFRGRGVERASTALQR